MFGRKKDSAIDRRLQELQREMTKVGGEIKSLAQREKGKDRLSGPPPGAPRFAAAETKPAEAAAPAAPAAGTESALPAAPAGGDISRAAAPPLESESNLPLFDRRPPLSPDRREKFANYFMAGHFSNLRPLRQEKRIIRNKAIVMIVLVALALIWLIFLLSSQ